MEQETPYHSQSSGGVASCNGLKPHIRSYGDLSSCAVICLFLHGAGLSGVSFSETMQELHVISGGRGLLISPDLRGHGLTESEDDSDLSAATLVDDAMRLLTSLAHMRSTRSRVVLIGHSLGGAVATRVACDPRLSGACDLGGLVVIETSEGSAMASFEQMRASVRDLPKSFSTVEEAVQCSVQRKLVPTVEAGRRLVPWQLRKDGDAFAWRYDLEATLPQWEQLYTGLTRMFLSVRVPRLVVLANYERMAMDADLMRSSLQGAFQVEVLDGTGHNVHEDAPAAFARLIHRFLTRNALLGGEQPG